LLVGYVVVTVVLAVFCVGYEREIGHSDAERHAQRVDELLKRLA
jgi:hypothetical protein